jgi:hypothetical protein
LPGGSAEEPSTATPPRRRRTLLLAGAAGAAVLLAGAGFVAGGGWSDHDQTTLIAGTSQIPPGAGQSAPDAQSDAQSDVQGDSQDDAQAGGQGGPGAADPDGDHRGGGRALDGARFTVGRISAVSGAVLTLTDFQGGAVKVTTTASTKVAGNVGGDLSALKVGELVFVAGSRQSDGSYLATSIATRPGDDADGDNTPRRLRDTQPGQSAQAGPVT